MASSNGPGDAVGAPTSVATPGADDAPPAKVPSEKEIARKLRKRELDRRAQRQARERTRNRIAELEAQVKELRKDDSTRLSACMEQLAAITQDRDRLADTLKVIDQTIRDNVATSGSSQKSSSSASIASLPGPQDAMSSMLTATSRHAAYTAPVTVASEMSSSGHGHAYNHGGVSTGAMVNMLPASSAHAPSVHAPSSTSDSQEMGEDLDDDDNCHEYHDDSNVIIPLPEASCDCITARTPSGPTPPKVNVWRAVNQVLAKRCRISQEEHVAEDASDEDIPVRVLLEGWDAVARSRPLSRLWKKLRRVDELCFHACPKTERLAILRIMHLLLQYHSDPTPSRHAKLPTWLFKRPSQTMPHSYAIDFFVWPGVRERFVFGQHHYCNNSFWDLFGPNLHILWPYEFRDAYQKCLVTGSYQINPMFEQRISDINSWTMGMDFFTRFPELIADIPAFHSLSQSLTPANTALASPQMPQQASLVQLKERDERNERMILDQQETAEDAHSHDASGCTQAMQIYPHGLYSMAPPAFMDEFLPHEYDVNTATASYGHLPSYF
ncbi:bZIP transcription [Colletotrichum truncatum]|uniref:BZIP transcription n=1 Tax=Colletotrichum truncatum TaxID=5467 RepID=A0ACC3YWE1_COLTU|nr:bZIP transcription protein [Colletotrichum truncatum]KAF6787427.1 bZIP transcription protein [Colletotrichum truncatum]